LAKLDIKYTIKNAPKNSERRQTCVRTKELLNAMQE
jgi:hypothetical protein